MLAIKLREWISNDYIGIVKDSGDVIGTETNSVILIEQIGKTKEGKTVSRVNATLLTKF